MLCCSVLNDTYGKKQLQENQTRKGHAIACRHTSVSGFAADGEVDVTLFSRLLHELHHQLVRLPHHRRAIHTDELVSGAQTAVLIR